MSVRFKINWLRLAVLFGGCGACLAGANAAETVLGQPATWMPHDLIVTLNHLSKRYSCNDLWYKFHDVLLEIGARPDMKILPYRCEPALGEAARSPSVQLNFQLPEVLRGKLARYADIRVVNSTVTLEPGHPSSFDSSDCDLLRQIKDTLFTRVYRVTSYDLPCRAPAIRAPEYSLSMTILKPVDESERRVANRADASDSAVARGSLGRVGHD
jgi:hypothetical protein